MSISTTMKSAQKVYYGPNALRYASAGSVSAGEAIIAHWKEENWCYIQYTVDSTGKPKRGYVLASEVNNISTLETLAQKREYDAGYRLSTACTVYFGPLTSGSYDSIGSLSTGETVEFLGVKENGYAFVDYKLDSDASKHKRGWADTNKFSTGPTHIFSAVTKNGCALKVIETYADNIQLVNLGRSKTLSKSGYKGINAAFFDIYPNPVTTLQIGLNNGIPVLNDYDVSQNGSVNSMGQACLTWTGTQLVFDASGVYNMSNISVANRVWSQGGISLRMGRTLSAVSSAISSEMNGVYSSSNYRTAICAELSQNKVYLIVSKTQCNVGTFREAIHQYLGIASSGSVEDTNIVGMVMDGGGSTTMVCPSYSWDQGRALVQCMVLKN